MFFDLLIAFIEGLALISSPCILSILPILLSASIVGGKRRPIAVIFGFIISFDLFTLFSKQLSLSLGLDLLLVKKISYIFLLFFGLGLLWDKLQHKIEILTQKLANLGNRLNQKTSFLAKEGIIQGITTGVLLGLIWTPCAGAILGAVITQVIKQETNFASLFILGAFSTGVAIPMLIIVLIGKKFVEKISLINRYYYVFRKVLGVIIIVSTLITGYKTIFSL